MPRFPLPRCAVAWIYLGLYSLCAVFYAFLPARAHARLLAWSSTNLVNMHHHPVGSLLASAFVPGDPAVGWVVLGAAGLFTVNRLLGNARTALLLVTGHVAGTLVSEGILAYEVDHAVLPASARTILDVGPSYVVVCALVAATLYGAPLRKTAAGIAFCVLATHIFRGAAHLEVTPVGHVVAVITGALLGGLLLLDVRRVRLRRMRLRGIGGPPAGPAGTSRARLFASSGRAATSRARLFAGSGRAATSRAATSRAATSRAGPGLAGAGLARGGGVATGLAGGDRGGPGDTPGR